MTLPAKFKFRHMSRGVVYSAAVHGPSCTVTWSPQYPLDSGHTTYTTEMVRQYVVNGDWAILEEKQTDLLKSSLALCTFIGEKKDASELVSGELEALHLLRRLITRLLDDRS